MKINVEYTNEMIKALIRRDMEIKLNVTPTDKEIDICVRSKQNYREKDWELGELKCELVVLINE